MKFIIRGEVPHYDVQVMSQVFFHNIGFELTEEIPRNGLCLVAEPDSVSLYNDNMLVGTRIARPLVEPLALSNAIYGILSDYTNYKPPWGTLTGIRPAKLITAMYAEGLTKPQAIAELMDRYLVTKNKASLCSEIAATQSRIMQTSPNDAVSIYINIPFCPTKCRYCSFMAYEIGKFGNRLPAYMEALLKEINHLGKICKDMYVENIYIGGGTPTALCDKNLEALLQTVKDNFDTESQPAKPFEYTIEAGRPDTVTQSNLALMKKYKVNRISINPQTLNESTLVKIGRGHSVQDFFNAYQTAKNHGFDFINIDLILGLEGETTQDVQNTLNGVSALNPNALTIHTLAIKRGSAIHNVPQAHSANVEKIEEMLNYAEEYIKQMELAPYYLYRQKNSPGNFENVGYSKPSFEGRYNIHMMEETRSVYAAGCGAVTKLVDNKNNKITRIVNYRGLDEYIRKVDELIERKYP